LRPQREQAVRQAGGEVLWVSFVARHPGIGLEYARSQTEAHGVAQIASLGPTAEPQRAEAGRRSGGQDQIGTGALRCQATKALMSESSLLVPAAPGSTQMVQSAYLQIVNRQAMIMMRAASELGFSPTARPRIGLTLGGGELNGPQDVPAGQESLDAYLQRAPKATAVH
jgi:hypothetical protein